MGRLKTITLKLRHTPNLDIDATVDVFTGRPLVCLHSEASLIEDINLTPTEADRLSRALAKAAIATRAKGPR